MCNSGPIKVTEHQLPEDEVIATFLAEDKDSGAFGQVVYSLAPGQADEVYTLGDLWNKIITSRYLGVHTLLSGHSQEPGSAQTQVRAGL